MRNVTFSMNISVDGYCDHTHFNPDEEIFEFFTDYLKELDTVVYGRKTYELMVPYWPEVAKAKSGTKPVNEFAEILTSVDKVVFSKTLDSVEGNTRIVRENPEDEIRKLKQQPGKKISIGGVNLFSQLMPTGLIDEFYFVVHPIIVGEGKRLFDDMGLQDKLNLKLVDSKVFKSGALGLHYLK